MSPQNLPLGNELGDYGLYPQNPIDSWRNSNRNDGHFRALLRKHQTWSRFFGYVRNAELDKLEDLSERPTLINPSFSEIMGLAGAAIDSGLDDVVLAIPPFKYEINPVPYDNSPYTLGAVAANSMYIEICRGKRLELAEQLITRFTPSALALAISMIAVKKTGDIAAITKFDAILKKMKQHGETHTAQDMRIEASLYPKSEHEEYVDHRVSYRQNFSPEKNIEVAYEIVEYVSDIIDQISANREDNFDRDIIPQQLDWQAFYFFIELAIQEKNSAVLETLLSRNIKSIPDDLAPSLLADAIATKDKKIVDLVSGKMRKASSIYMNSVGHKTYDARAMSEAYEEVVYSFIDRGMDQEACMAVETLRDLVADSNIEGHVLLYAVTSNQEDVLRSLLTKYPHIDYDKNSLYESAISGRCYLSLKVLLEKCVIPNDEFSMGKIMSYACASKNLEVLEEVVSLCRAHNLSFSSCLSAMSAAISAGFTQGYEYILKTAHTVRREAGEENAALDDLSVPRLASGLDLAFSRGYPEIVDAYLCNRFPGDENAICQAMLSASTAQDTDRFSHLYGLAKATTRNKLFEIGASRRSMNKRLVAGLLANGFATVDSEGPGSAEADNKADKIVKFYQSYIPDIQDECDCRGAILDGLACVGNRPELAYQFLGLVERLSGENDDIINLLIEKGMPQTIKDAHRAIMNDDWPHLNTLLVVPRDAELITKALEIANKHNKPVALAGLLELAVSCTNHLSLQDFQAAVKNLSHSAVADKLMAKFLEAAQGERSAFLEGLPLHRGDARGARLDGPA